MTHSTCVARHSSNVFHLETLIDLILTFTQSKAYTYMWYLLHPLRNIMAMLGFVAITTTVSVTDKAKSDNFDLSTNH